jgi:hypothetical protein
MRRPPDSPKVGSSGEVGRDTLPIASAPARHEGRALRLHPFSHWRGPGRSGTRYLELRPNGVLGNSRGIHRVFIGVC